MLSGRFFGHDIWRTSSTGTALEWDKLAMGTKG